MNFIDFCKAHGVVIDRTPRMGVWERFSTETHPRKKNAAVKYMGNYGFLVDFSTGSESVVWKADEENKIDAHSVKVLAKKLDEQKIRLQDMAAKKAKTILDCCLTGSHEYLRRKGFKREQGLIWCHDKTEHLIVPMYIGKNLVGAQMIDAEGGKKFLYGQKTSGANFIIGSSGPYVLCEGYATGLSVRDAMLNLKQNWRVVVCFSASNLVTTAKALPSGFVVADHDKLNKQTGTRAGEEAAKKTGWPYWVPPEEGTDFNDYHQHQGLGVAALSLWESMRHSTNRIKPVLTLRDVVALR